MPDQETLLDTQRASPPEVETAPAAAPDVVDHFRLVRLLARGGNGEVYLARDTKLGRKVALKLIRRDILGTGDAVARFLLEARATALFSHPHIVTVYAAGEHNGRPYVALEYLEGQTLRERLVEGPPSIRDALRFGLAIADALEEAHRHGILHRDLKPENVLIPKDGRLRVLDFGLAKRFTPGDELPTVPMSAAPAVKRPHPAHHDHDLPLLASVGIAGTPAYMAPEQWTGDSATGATDVWALGVILFELLSGQRPVAGTAAVEISSKVLSPAPMPPLPPITDLPLGIRELVERALSKPPAARPAAADIAAALRSALARPNGEVEDVSPFRGLAALEERHADRFFGRGGELAAFLERMRDEPVLPLVGPSGAGKSSFVQAGVMPRLRDQGRRWVILRMRPGRRPFHALAQRFLSGEAHTSVSSASGAPPEEIERVAAELTATPELINLQLRALAEHERAWVLLFVDQLEEIYTLVEDRELRTRFMTALSAAADDAADPVRVVFTLRDDFLGKVGESAAARAVLSRLMLLRTPEPDALEEIITRPLDPTGFRFEDPALVREIVGSVSGESAALPLLQFACRALWERRDPARRLLLRSAYESFGGVAGALASHADSVVDGLSSEEVAEARQMLLRLITPEETRCAVAQRRLLDGLGPGAPHVLERLVQARLLAVRRGGENAELELVHESLIRSWGRLARWVDESREDAAVLHELTQAAEHWVRRGARPQETWRGASLRDAARAVERMRGKPPAVVARFIKAGTAHEKRRARIARTAIAATMAILAAAALVSYRAKERAELEHERAELRTADVLAESAETSLLRGDAWEARAKARASLEIADSTEARALWARIEGGDLVFRTHAGRGLNHFTYARDAAVLVLAEPSGAKVMDARTYEQRARFPVATEGSVFATALSHAGDLVAFTVHGAFEVHTVDGARRASIAAHDQAIWRLVFSPDGRLLASSSWDGTVKLWRTDQLFAPAPVPERVLRGHQSRVYGVAFAPDGRSLATASHDALVRVFDLSADTAPRVLDGAAGPVDHVAFTPDGRWLVSGARAGKITAWDVNSGARRWQVETPARFPRVAIDPRGELVAVGGFEGRVIAFLSTASGHPARRPIEVASGSVVQVEFVSNGEGVAWATYQGSFEVRRLREPWPERPQDLWTAPAVALEGARVATKAEDGVVTVRDEDGRVSGEIMDRSGAVRAIAFDRRGDTLVVGKEDGLLNLWTWPISEPPRVLRHGEQPIASVKFARDDSLRAVSASGAVRTFGAGYSSSGGFQVDLRLPQVLALSGGGVAAFGPHSPEITLWRRGELRRVTAGGRGVVGAAASLDGRTFAAISAGSRLLELWSADAVFVAGGGTEPRARLVNDFEPSPGGTSCVALSPDGASIAVSARAGVRLFDAASGRPGMLLPHHGAIFWCAFIAGGERILTFEDGLARLWDARTGRPAWRAPLLTSSRGSGAELLTHRGFEALGGARATRGDGGQARWRRALADGAIRADVSPDGRRACSLTLERKIELWDLERDVMIADTAALPDTSTASARGDGVVASGGGCLAVVRGRAEYLDTAGSRRVAGDEVTALFRGGERVFAVAGDRVVELTSRGGSDGELMTVRAGVRGATAIAAEAGATAVGFADGRIEVDWGADGAGSAGRPLLRFSGAAEPVTRLLFGPRGTVVAGYAQGRIAIYVPRWQREVLEARVHGPVAHLEQVGGTVHAVSEIGSHTTIDLSALILERGALLDRIRAAAPMTWREGRLVPTRQPVPPGAR